MAEEFEAKAQEPEALNEPPMRITEDNLDNYYVQELIIERLGSGLYKKLLAEKSLKRVPNIHMLQDYYQGYRDDILRAREVSGAEGEEAAGEEADFTNN